MTGSAVDLLGSNALRGRTLLLGNGGGFVLYQPVEQNHRDRTLVPGKWFGVSAFGRQYLAALRCWIVWNGTQTALDREVQTGFRQDLDRAVRTFQVDGCTVTQTFSVPAEARVVVMHLEGSSNAGFVVEPQFDMRYYQAFNSDFSGYRAALSDGAGGSLLHVSNHIENVTTTVPSLDFFCAVGSAGGQVTIELLPETERLRPRVYLEDEARQFLIKSAYSETHDQFPDEAPIWDTYGTTVFAPAQLSGASPMELVFAFGDSEADVDTLFGTGQDVPALLGSAAAQKGGALADSAFETGDEAIDLAYRTVLSRFNSCLVARNVPFRGEQGEEDRFTGILAGNKYFLDPWKRDENISLRALLAIGDYETTRAILADTWRFQDPRTGRLPQIIRMGEKVVYYSSDGTLWALRRLWEYTTMSGDRALLEAKYAMVEHFFTASLTFAQRGLLPSGKIIDPSYLWETWEDTAYTPRDGFPVEIEMLWLTALRDYGPVVAERNPDLATQMEATLTTGHSTFERFRLDGYLADSLSYDWEPRRLLTPNGYIGFGIGFPLPEDLARCMVMLGREQLQGQVGIRSLAPRDWPQVLSPEFMANPHNFRNGNMASVGLYNYHRGIEWLWLNQFFVEGELRFGDVNNAYRRYVAPLVHAALDEGGVGGLSELYDTRGPLGADFQAWSMAGFVVALRAFAGIHVDAASRVVSLAPRLPEAWPQLHLHNRVADTRFEMRMERVDGGGLRLEIGAATDPSGYTLRICVPQGPGTIAVNGEPLAPDGQGGSRWVQIPFSRRVQVDFLS